MMCMKEKKGLVEQPVHYRKCPQIVIGFDGGFVCAAPPVEVIFVGKRIKISYEKVLYEGKWEENQNGNGSYKLMYYKNNRKIGEASLHLSSINVESLVGEYTEEGDKGFWKIWLK